MQLPTLLFSGDNLAVFVKVDADALSYLAFLLGQLSLVTDNPVLDIDCDTGDKEINNRLHCHRYHLVVCCPQIASRCIQIYESLTTECGWENI